MAIERRRFFPCLESLESIVALSGMSSEMTAAIVSAATARNVVLTGEISGLYRARSFPDVGKSYTLTHGVGNVSALGRTRLTGNLELPGLFVAPAGSINSVKAIGTLVLSTGKGSLILDLSAPSSARATSLPRAFSYTITGATGKFKGDTGAGWVAIQVIHGPRQPTPRGAEHGRFHLELLTVPPPAA
jgi:hypothetical protein